MYRGTAKAARGWVGGSGLGWIARSERPWLARQAQEKNRAGVRLPPASEDQLEQRRGDNGQGIQTAGPRLDRYRDDRPQLPRVEDEGEAGLLPPCVQEEVCQKVAVDQRAGQHGPERAARQRGAIERGQASR